MRAEQRSHVGCTDRNEDVHAVSVRKENRREHAGGKNMCRRKRQEGLKDNVLKGRW